MSAGKYTLQIEQGATLNLKTVFQDGDGLPIDLTGWTFRGQIRKKHSEATSIVSLTLETNAPATDGVLWVRLTDVQTAAIPVDAAATYRREPTRYTYDIEGVRSDGAVLRLMEGDAEISPEVTR